MTDDMKKKERGMNISIWINQETLDEIDNIATYADLTRSKFIQNIIEVGIDELNVFKAVGIVKLSLRLLEMRKQLKKAVEEIPGKRSISDKRMTDRGINVSIWMERSMVENIEILAKKVNMSRSDMVEIIIDMGVSDMRLAINTGFADIALVIRNLHDKWKKYLRKTEKEYEKGRIVLDSTDTIV